jgi:stage V sporulation protein G
MEITEVRIFPRESPDKKLKAYATVTFDNAFVVRNIKVIQGASGLFIAMPSRRIKRACPKCGYRNELKSKFCNFCGGILPLTPRPSSPSETNLSEHRDICHPITQSFREYLSRRVLEAYQNFKSIPPREYPEKEYPEERRENFR